MDDTNKLCQTNNQKKDQISQKKETESNSSALTIIQKYKKKSNCKQEVDDAELGIDKVLQENNLQFDHLHEQEVGLASNKTRNQNQNAKSYNYAFNNNDQTNNQFSKSLKRIVRRILTVLIVIWFLYLGYSIANQNSQVNVHKQNKLKNIIQQLDQTSKLQKRQQFSDKKQIEGAKDHQQQNTVNIQKLKVQSNNLKIQKLESRQKPNINIETKNSLQQQPSNRPFQKLVSQYAMSQNADFNIQKKLQMTLKFWMTNRKDFDQNQQLKDYAKFQKNYYEKKYQISKFGEVQMCVLVWGMNDNDQAKDKYFRNLDSIFQQEYSNFQVYYIDNFQSIQTKNLVQQYIHDKKLSKKMKLHNNMPKLSKYQNLFTIGQQNCQLGSVMMILEGSDELIGRQAFKTLSSVYQAKQVYFAFTQNVQINQISKAINEGKNNQFSDEIIQNTNYRNSNIQNQLKTWISDLFFDIKKQEIHLSNNLNSIAQDAGLSFALMEKAGKKNQFINQYFCRIQNHQQKNIETLNQIQSQISQYKKIQKLQPFKNKISLQIRPLSQLNLQSKPLVQSKNYQKKIENFQKQLKSYRLQNQQEGIRQKLSQTLKFWMMNGRNVLQNNQLKRYAQEQKKYYESKYQISKYSEAQICLVVLSYMNEANDNYKKNLDSIFQQDYQNFNVLYVDDFSQDKTAELVENYINQNNVEKKIKLFKNKVHKGKAANEYQIGRICNPGTIMIVINGQDQLIGRQVFKFLNAAYQKNNLYYLYTQHITINQNDKVVKRGNSQQISEETIQNEDYRKGVVPGHLRSWISDIFLDLKKENIFFEGDFPGQAEQMAFNFALLQKAGANIGFFNEYIYKLSQNTNNNFIIYDKRAMKQTQSYYKRMEKLSAYQYQINLNIKVVQGVQKVNKKQVLKKVSYPLKEYRVLSQDSITKKKLQYILKFWQGNGKNFTQSPRIKNIVRLQKQYYEKKYSISKYSQIQFCVVVLSFMNEANNRYLKNLDSIFQQSYSNYKVYFVDDASYDKTFQLVSQYMVKNKLQDKLKLFKNQNRKRKLQNLFEVGQKNCKPGTIMMTIDGDDQLIGKQVFNFLNAVYQQKGLYFLYTQSVVINQQLKTIQEGESKTLQNQTIQNIDYRKKSTPKQLSAWMSDLFLDIKQQDLLYKNKFPAVGSDLGLYFMLMEKAGKNVAFLNEYVYRFVRGTGLNDYWHKDAQNQMEKYYRSLPKFPVYSKKIVYSFKQETSISKKSFLEQVSLYNLDNQEESVRTKLNQTLKLWMMTGRNISQNKVLMQFAEKEKSYFQKQYQISKYDQIQICVVVLSYMNQENNRYKRNLDSIFQQDYDNFKVYYVDDFSEDRTGELVQKYIKDNKLQSKLKLFRNKVHKKKSQNQFYTGQQNCKPGSIMIVVDGDDQLIGRQVFKFVNAVFQKFKLYYMYSQHVVIEQAKSSIKRGFSQQISKETIQNMDYRKSFIPSHLRCWMTDLFLDMKKEDIYYKDDFPGPAQDVGLNFQMMEKAGKNVRYFNQYVYRYSWDTGLNNYRHRDVQMATQSYYRSLPKFPVYSKPIVYSIKSRKAELKKQQKPPELKTIQTNQKNQQKLVKTKK